jgi:hypothetical protein
VDDAELKTQFSDLTLDYCIRIVNPEDMSDMPDDGVAEDYISILVNNKEVLMKRQELIHELLHENIRYDKTNVDDLMLGLNSILKRDVDTEKSNEISNALLNFIVLYDEESAGSLKKRNVDERFIDFLSKLAIKHQAVLGEILRDARQGTEHWIDIDAEMVVRENFGDRGLNYLIKKSNDREVELSTNLDSNLRLINFLLAKQTQAMDYFDDRATLELEKENIEELLERMEALHRMYEDTLDAHNE